MGALYETCNPSFPLWRAFLLLYSWVSKPIPFYHSKYFELMCFIHSYGDLFTHVSYVPCFAHCSYLEVYYFESFIWKLAICELCKLSTILQPRAKFAITNYDLLYVSLLCFVYLLQVSYIIVSCILLWSMYWWMWCFLSVFFYRLFTP